MFTVWPFKESMLTLRPQLYQITRSDKKPNRNREEDVNDKGPIPGEDSSCKCKCSYKRGPPKTQERDVSGLPAENFRTSAGDFNSSRV